MNGLSIKIDDVEYAHAVRNQIAELLPPPGYNVRSWMELNAPLFSAIQVEKNLMFAGHAAYHFKQDPFYSNNFTPTMKQLVDRILTGD